MINIHSSFFNFRTSVEDDEKQMIDETYQILVTMAMEEEPRKIFCNQEIVALLCQAFGDQYYSECVFLV